MRDDDREAVGCGVFGALFAACVAVSVALGMLFGAWVGLMAFAAGCVAFAALCLCGAARRDGDDGE